MLKRLGLGLLLVACSSESGSLYEGGGGTENGGSPVGASGSKAMVSGGSATAGSPANAESGAGGEPTPSVSGGSGGGATSGAGGGLSVAGAGGATAGAPSGGGGGSSGSGGQQTAGEPGADEGGSGGEGGAGSEPDLCAGKMHWSATERWTDYEQGDQRVFGGVLWHCQSPPDCVTFPGSPVSPGWFKDAECAGGPTGEVAACQCATGQCCDGCYVRPRSYFCGEVVRTAQCVGPVVNQCGGATDTIDKDWWNLFCDGAESVTCSRWGAHKKYSNGDCPAGTGCVEQGDQASCAACN
jgi:hypothetical protein